MRPVIHVAPDEAVQLHSGCADTVMASFPPAARSSSQAPPATPGTSPESAPSTCSTRTRTRWSRSPEQARVRARGPCAQANGAVPDWIGGAERKRDTAAVSFQPLPTNKITSAGHCASTVQVAGLQIKDRRRTQLANGAGSQGRGHDRSVNECATFAPRGAPRWRPRRQSGRSARPPRDPREAGRFREDQRDRPR